MDKGDEKSVPVQASVDGDQWRRSIVRRSEIPRFRCTVLNHLQADRIFEQHGHDIFKRSAGKPRPQYCPDLIGPGSFGGFYSPVFWLEKGELHLAGD